MAAHCLVIQNIKIEETAKYAENLFFHKINTKPDTF
jgi:hypothetical protein